MTRAPAPTSLTLRPLARDGLTAIVSPAGAVLTVLPSREALALMQSLTPCTAPVPSLRRPVVIRSRTHVATIERLPPRLAIVALDVAA